MRFQNRFLINQIILNSGYTRCGLFHSGIVGFLQIGTVANDSSWRVDGLVPKVPDLADLSQSSWVRSAPRRN